jgi:hypothetical protein
MHAYHALAEGELTGEEHRERIGKASNAVTPGDLKLLVQDLQSNTAPARLHTGGFPLKFGRWPIIQPANDRTQPEALTSSVYVSTDYGGGSIEFKGDGTTKRLSLPS